MFIRITNSMYFKPIAVFLALTLMVEIFSPSLAFALTGGPSQPEVETFEPIGTNQMVDLFSGDFNYNIHLLTVPGPDGGYPVNLAYHAGVGMEQEASWVGLGWNINPGVINRNMRGLPDDFNGETVTKEQTSKADRTFAIGVDIASVNSEFFGLDLSKSISGLQGSYQLYYNTYRGVGQQIGLSMTGKGAEGIGGSMSPQLGLNFDSQTGLSVSPSLSYSGKIDEVNFKFNGGPSFHSREGLTSLKFSTQTNFLRKAAKAKYKDKDGKPVSSNKRLTASAGGGTSFVGASSVPSVDFPRTGGTYEVEVKAGTVLFGTTIDLDVHLSYSYTELAEKSLEFLSYGFMYSENAVANNTLMDFNREKAVQITQKNKSLPIPIQTQDIYAVSAQGMGGTFKPYRSDIGKYRDASSSGSTDGWGGGTELDFGSPPQAKTGVNAKTSYTSYYSGDWSGNNSSISHFKFRGKDDAAVSSNRFYEPVYFKNAGEQLLTNQSNSTLLNGEPWRFSITQISQGLAKRPVVKPMMRNHKNQSLNATSGNVPTYNTTRERRSQLFEYLTRSELGLSALPNTNYTAGGSQIGEISILNPQGQRYVYGLPAYNYEHTDYLFSVNHTGNAGNKLTPYSSTDRTLNNSKGNDHFYSSTQLPPYAHSYLLTQVLSDDYVDVTGNGPTDDDFGSYTKFTYDLASSNYQWRTPYEEDNANLMIGHYSDFTDDKASFSYGVKDVHYLETIETKTHKAVFECSIRSDAMGVPSSDGGSGGVSLKKLDKIILYSKENPNVPIKTVHFEYDYSLCEGIPNTSMAGGGKLTLSRVWFTYSDYETKSKLNPYIFDYDKNSSDANPDYDYAQSNRWGYYQPNKTGSGVEILTHENPYVNQRSDYDYSGNTCNVGDATDVTKRNLHASAWCLRKITLPSGGEITVDYESDDYAYVQNKKAMQMCRIVNTGSSSGKKDGKINASNRRIYFELDTPISTSDPDKVLKLASYFEDVKDIYFKAFVKLKRFPSGAALSNFPYELNGVAYDYVEGYAEKESVGFDETTVCVGESNYYTTAWVDLKDVPVNDKGTLGEGSAHPISKAVWQYLRLKRPDLFKQPNTPAGNALSISDIINFSGTALSILKEAAKMLLGYYTYAKVNGYGNEILLSGSTKPSYIRLNKANGIKYGGGHRVKRIALNDNWNNMTNALVNYPDNSYDYGQEYIYRLPDGKSSGVAEYEPLIGGEENPFRKPVRYPTDRRLVTDLALYVEEPYNESYFPAPGVGYSRVEVRNLERQHNSQKQMYSTSGTNVHEFYTAKDYPVISQLTPIEKTKFNKTIFIPFLGSKQFNDNGYSQGYSIELNDMHGKVKSVANYSTFADLQKDLPVTRTDYIYATVNGYQPDKVNTLKSEVTVLTADGVHQQGEIGKHVEMFMDMREDKVESENYGVSVNMTIIFNLPVPFPTPNFSNSDAITRTVVTNKVISRTGILEKLVQYNEGQKIVTDNLMFDSETGQPLLTTVTNDFDAPVYTYNYASHWYYDGMGGAYKNYKVQMAPINTAYLLPGDILMDNSGNLYWVEVAGSTPVVKDENNYTVTNLNFSAQIIRSGRRNLQSTPVGKIVTLDNIASGSPDFLEYYNTVLVNDPNFIIPGPSDIHLEWSFHSCATGLTDIVDFYGNVNDNKLFFNTAASNCGRTIDVSSIPNFWTNYKDYIFTYSPVTINCENDEHQFIAKHKTSGQTYTVTFTVTTSPAGTSPCNCFKPCLRVLHAEAYTFKHAWDYYYENEYSHEDIPLADINANPYRYGKQGVWRMEETYNYIEKRLLTRKRIPQIHEAYGTKINKDGEYDIFVAFHWADPNLNVKQWNMINTVTRYSPYGYALEAKNALEVFSAELYGYNRSAVTASASNAKHQEIAFDGFEDYKNNQYGSPYNNGHGNFVLLDPNYNFDVNPNILTSSQAHTGRYSIKVEHSKSVFYGHVPAGNNYPEFNHKFTPDPNNKYMLSVWVKSDDADVIPTVKIKTFDGYTYTSIANAFPGNNDSYIDGWYKLDAYFDIATMGSTHSLNIEFFADGTGSGNAYFDDLRVHPVQARFKSYVYDPLTMRLAAELDENNYATFFVYDSEGKITQVKKETAKGTLTLKENRTKFSNQ
ncbi:MAG: hypothetical protein QY303_10320 [Vicingaceae bacterium]|nr:hypothetical protein [Flavobacteriales bacterium]WKZ74536.1 MAG: hypothetical protein QY303_10320 [Vicingaceae bacterium]